MEKSQNYRERDIKESKFHLSIPKGLEPKPQQDFIELLGGSGHYSFQHYAEYCLTNEGNELSLGAFKTNFTAWSLEGAGGVVLYPEGPAFQVLGAQFMEGDPPVVFQADPAHYTALRLCLHPTVFPPGAPADGELASYQVTMTTEQQNEPFCFIPQKPIDVNGEIFQWRHLYIDQKVSFKIEIMPSPTGRNTILLGGRLGTIRRFPLSS